MLYKSTGGEKKINEFDWFSLCDYFLHRVLRLRILKEAQKKRQSEERVSKEREKKQLSIISGLSSFSTHNQFPVPQLISGLRRSLWMC